MSFNNVPETCTYCPHLDEFHSSCSHPMRQAIIWELVGNSTACPVFTKIYAEEMHTLEEYLCNNNS